jgi:hypothetical protein
VQPYVCDRMIALPLTCSLGIADYPGVQQPNQPEQ